MKELVICSGKGGTGKTSVAASLAALAEEFVLADCDVDAANLHLLALPTRTQTTPFLSGRLARIDPTACNGCGECADLCRFEALDRSSDPSDRGAFFVDPLRCEGCGVCARFCPAAAIDFSARHCGQWHLSQTSFGSLVHAELDVGAENSGKLVSLVREQARQQALRSGMELVLIDGPPGIGCPVTAALTGADLALLVTEPSRSGLHDLRRIVDLSRHFETPVLVCVNKFDLSPAWTDRIEAYCRENELPLLDRIPYEPLVNEAQTVGRSLVEYAPGSAAARAMVAVWHHVEHRLALTADAKG